MDGWPEFPQCQFPQCESSHYSRGQNLRHIHRFQTGKVWQHRDVQGHCKPDEYKWNSLERIHTVNKVENKSSHKADMPYIWHVLSTEYVSFTAAFSAVHKGIKCLNIFCLGLGVCKVLQHHWACVFLSLSNSTMFLPWHFVALGVLLVVKPPQATVSVSLGTFSVGPFKNDCWKMIPQSSTGQNLWTNFCSDKTPLQICFCSLIITQEGKILPFCHLHHCY